MGGHQPEALNSIVGEVQQYLETSREHVRLLVFKMTMHIITAMGKSFMVGGLLVLALMFLSFSSAWALGRWLQSDALGFLLVGVLYLLVALIGYWKREKLHGPILRYFSKRYFEL